MSVIQGKSLESRPVRDLGEAVGQVPGVSIDGGATNFGGYAISIRGMPSSYTLLLVDGKRQDASSETFPNVSYSQAVFMPPISAIDRIEVIRGPASTIYGSDAIGGLVNVILKKSFDKWSSNILLNTTLQEEKLFGHSFSLSAYTGGPLDSAKKLSLQIRAKNTYQLAPRSFEIQVPGANNTTNNQIVTSNTAALIGGGKNDQWNVGARVGYEMNEKNYFYIDYSHAGQWYDPTPVGATENFENSFFTRNNSIVRHQGSYGSNGLLKTDTSFQYNNMYNETRNRMSNDVVLEHRTSMPISSSKLNVGFQYMYNSVAALNNTVFGANLRFIQRHNYAVYAENELAVLDNLLLTLGMRLNMNSNFGFNISPRAYIVYNVLEDFSVGGIDIGDLSIKGGVSTGYRMPNITNVTPGWTSSTGRGSIRVYGNPDLKPESSLNYELGILSDSDYAQISFIGFYTNFYDKISSQTVVVGGALPSGFTCDAVQVGTVAASCRYSINVDTAKSYGIELFGSMKPLNVGVGNIGFDLSYTWNKNEATSGTTQGLPLVGIPEHTLNMSLNYNYNDIVGMYIRGEFRANQVRDEVTTSLDALNAFLNLNNIDKFYKPYFLMHLGINYNATKNLRMQFGIYNLFNHNFVDYYYALRTGNASPTVYNNYASIYEGRRYYLAISYDF